MAICHVALIIARLVAQEALQSVGSKVRESRPLVFLQIAKTSVYAYPTHECAVSHSILNGVGFIYSFTFTILYLCDSLPTSDIDVRIAERKNAKSKLLMARYTTDFSITL